MPDPLQQKWDRYHRSHKTIRSLACRISIMMLRKLRQDEPNNPVMFLEFTGHMYYPPEKWVLIPKETYDRLIK